MAIMSVCATNLVRNNLTPVQNMSKYHSNLKNGLTMLKYNFVTHNLPKKFKHRKESTSRPKMAIKCVDATN